MSSLEPIEEKDLDLEGKFLGKGEAEKPVGADESKPEAVPSAASADKQIERIEGAVEKESAYAKILSKVKTSATPAHDESVHSDAQTVSQKNDAETKIDTLVRLAETKGVPHAVKVARHLDDNYALDEFHDRLLAEDLHDALMKKGLIKEI